MSEKPALFSCCVVQNLGFPGKEHSVLGTDPMTIDETCEKNLMINPLAFASCTPLGCSQNSKVPNLCLPFSYNNLERIKNHFTAFMNVLLPLQLPPWEADCTLAITSENK